MKKPKHHFYGLAKSGSEDDDDSDTEMMPVPVVSRKYVPLLGLYIYHADPVVGQTSIQTLIQTSKKHLRLAASIPAGGNHRKVNPHCTREYPPLFVERLALLGLTCRFPATVPAYLRISRTTVFKMFGLEDLTMKTKLRNVIPSA